MKYIDYEDDESVLVVGRDRRWKKWKGVDYIPPPAYVYVEKIDRGSYYQNHKAEMIANAKRWNDKNPERAKASRIKYAQKNR